MDTSEPSNEVYNLVLTKEAQKLSPKVKMLSLLFYDNYVTKLRLLVTVHPLKLK